MEAIEFPVIYEPSVVQPKTTAVATVEMTAVAIAPLQQMRAALQALADKYRMAAFDVTTPKGLAEAKAARNDLRELGRYAVQRATARFKAEANDAKRAVDALADQMVAITLPIEEEIDRAIKAEEERRAEVKRKEAEAKAAAERAEAERVAAHQANVAGIRAYVEQARNLPSDRIGKGIAAVEALVFGPEWEEFAHQAEDARRDTLRALQDLHDAAKASEEAAARIEAQRIENERVAAELAEQRRQIEAQAAELKRRQEAAAERERLVEQERQEQALIAAAEQAERDQRAEDERIAREQREADGRNHPMAHGAGTVECGPGHSAGPAAGPPTNVPNRQEQPPVTDIDAANREARDEAPIDPETGEVLVPAANSATLPNRAVTRAKPAPMPLQMLCDRLEFSVPPALLGNLGFTSPLLVRDFPAICDALIDHITTKRGA